MINLIKKFLLAIVFSLLLVPAYNILADSYKCVYKYEDDYELTISIDPANKDTSLNPEIIIDQINCTFCWKYESTTIIDFWVVDDPKIHEEVRNNIYNGSCDSTILLFKYWSNSAQQYYFKLLLNDTLEAEAIEAMQTNFSSGTYKELRYSWVQPIVEKSTAPFKDVAYKCSMYDNLYGNLQNLYNDIQNCETNCVGYYNEYNRTLTELKEYCLVQMKYLDYGKSCLNVCLNLSEELEKIKIYESPNGNCGLSGKLIIWISNIVKWGKYLVPIIVIVLGILDFIKAIASGKDDEMKKAQGRFIKRLIAAALIFIIPFIIEFVLNKMGFDANGCGIIDL